MPASLLTDELRAVLERELATGAQQIVVRQRTGVSPRSLKRWLAQGKVQRPAMRGRPPAPLPVSAQLAQAEPGLVGAIIAAADRGSWQAAAWLLERSFPDRWARREPGKQAAVADRFSEVDELATKR